MREPDHKQATTGQCQNADELDHELDSALAKYAAVEPRPNLEDRILANLRAHQTRVSSRAWWRWGLAATAAAVVVVSVALAWKSGTSSGPAIANHPAKQGPEKASAQLATPHTTAVRPRGHAPNRKASAHPSRTLAVAGNLKLDQFPSPRPLSAQEKLLQAYVAEFPERAVLIARARSEALRRDQLEEMQLSPSDNEITDSEEPNHDTNER